MWVKLCANGVSDQTLTHAEQIEFTYTLVQERGYLHRKISIRCLDVELQGFPMLLWLTKVPCSYTIVTPVLEAILWVTPLPPRLVVTEIHPL